MSTDRADGPPATATVAVIEVELIASPAPGRLLRMRLALPSGSRVADALRASGWLAQLTPAELDALAPSVWGRRCATDTPLRDGDRLELTRPLLVDPKEARRLRYRRDGLRRAPRRAPPAG